jgi:hypothetical protein
MSAPRCDMAGKAGRCSRKMLQRKRECCDFGAWRAYRYTNRGSFWSVGLKSIMGCRENKRALSSELFRQMTMQRYSLVSGTRHRPYRGHAERWLEFLVRIDVTSVDSALGPRLLSQVLKDWLRVQRHLEQGDFARYFSGVELQSVPPMVCLVAPALRFQPATAILLRYLSPQAEAARVGLAESRRRGRCVVRRQ